MSEESIMGGRQPVLQVTGRLPAEVLVDLERVDAGVRLRTLLRLGLRDEAALQGVLRRLHGMGLELVEMHPVADDASPRVIEFVLDGAIGELALQALSDHVDVLQTATRVTFSDSAALSGGLALVVARGLTVEFASAVPTPLGVSTTGAAT